MADAPSLNVRLLVADTSPLITLAAADALDYLFYIDLPVVIPDGVFYEATRHADKLGAAQIIDWANAHGEHVHIAPTTIFAATGGSPVRVKSLGELSAIEAIQSVRLEPEERALLLFEDSNAVQTIAPTDQIVPVSTKDYLNALQNDGRIQSADAVFERAYELGRAVSQLQLIQDRSPEEREALEAALRRARPIGDILKSKDRSDLSE